MEITFNYFARQYVSQKHEFIKATLKTLKETYHHRHCLLAKVKLDEENTKIYQQKLGKKYGL